MAAGQENRRLALKMRTNVTFRHPAEFVPVSDADGILAVGGAQWFAALLRRVPALEVDEDLCQEDWGVVLLVRRNQRKFWIGLSAWDSLIFTTVHGLGCSGSVRPGTTS